MQHVSFDKALQNSVDDYLLVTTY